MSAHTEAGGPSVEAGLWVTVAPFPEGSCCACPDEKAHWRRFAAPPHPMVLLSECCSILGCLGGFEDALPVRRVGDGPERYLIPLCADCLLRVETAPFRIKTTTCFALAEPGKTCRK